MVAMVVGLVATIVMMQVFAFAEGQKRTTTSGADAQVNGQLGMYSLARSLKIAGFGLAGTDCVNLVAYNENFADPKKQVFSALPVSISYDSTTGSDQVEVRYSLSAYGSISAILQQDMANSNASVRLNTGRAFKQKDLFIISEAGKDCTVLQASADAALATDNAANVTQDGLQWEVPHAANATYPFNPPSSTNIFPTGGYHVGAKVRSFGGMVNLRYYVQDGNLMVMDLNQPTSATNPIQVAAGITMMRAQYGVDTDGNGTVDSYTSTTPASLTQLLTVRLAVVARNGNADKDHTATTLSLWDGGPTVSFSGDAANYRYRVYLTSIPMRNTVWNN
jgi:type IV pilus assembly protein PilW